MYERLLDFEHHCRINNMFRPLVGELLMSTPKVFYRELGDGQVLERTLFQTPTYWVKSEQLPSAGAEVRGETRGRPSVCIFLFCLVYGISQSRNPLLSPNLQFCQSGQRAAAQWDGAEEGPGVWGDNWFFNNFHPILLILVPLPHSFLPSSRGNQC